MTNSSSVKIPLYWSKKFTEEQAKYGVDHCGADWYEQAVKEADSYLRHSEFTYSELLDQLEYEGFTYEEARYGVNNCSKKWWEKNPLAKPEACS